jgi:L-iditol 2-dehydrogenase
MLAARLYGPRDIRIDDVPEPPPPGPGQIILRVTAVGVCGSDLHNFVDGRIGDTIVETPIILGHEFAGVVEAVGENARDGLDNPLVPGQRVAVDPATPCYRCEFCEEGHPNLCRRVHFHGLWPDDGALQERMICEARSCFPLPDTLSDSAGALLEPLGIAMHAVDLAKLKVARSVAIIGCGCIGQMILRLAKLSGADPIYSFDCFPWRAAKAQASGAAKAWTPDEGDPVALIHEETGGRGVDVVFEAAWSDHSIDQAMEMAKLGGRVMVVGIPSDDRMVMKHSTARRKGLTIMMARRMKHTYPRAIRIATNRLNLDELISHRFPLKQTAEAFALNADYKDEVQKVVVEVASS